MEKNCRIAGMSITAYFSEGPNPCLVDPGAGPSGKGEDRQGAERKGGERKGGAGGAPGRS